MDLRLIADTIHELENGETTFENCYKLASLYVVRDHLEHALLPVTDNVEDELQDILPQYRKYCETKKKFQLKETTKDEVIDSLHSVGQEIREFIQTLYSNTDTPEEREYLVKLLHSLVSKYK